jgi:hypothetical protein
VRVHSKIARGNISFSIWVLRSESVEIDPREMDPNRSSPSDPVNIRTPHLNLAHHHNCEIFMQTTPIAVPSATPLPRVPLVPEDVAAATTSSSKSTRAFAAPPAFFSACG